MELTKISQKLNKIAELISTEYKTAAVVRNEDIDFYLDQLGKLLDAEGYDSKAKAVQLFRKLHETYDQTTAEKLRNQLRADGYTATDQIIRLVNQALQNIRSVEITHETTAIDLENRKAARETIDFLKALLPKLQHVSGNCRKLNLEDEANHVTELKVQFEDILLTISRLLDRGLKGKK